MPTIYIKTDEGNYIPLPGQVAPQLTEVGHEEAWVHNVKDMVDDWSNNRAGNARAWNERTLIGSRTLDEYTAALRTQMMRHTEEMHDARQRRAEEAFSARERMRAQLDNVFTNALQMSTERMGTKQDVSAERLHLDPSKTAAEAISAGLANQSQTQGAVSSAIAADVAESLRDSVVAINAALATQIAAMGDALAGKMAETLSNTKE